MTMFQRKKTPAAEQKAELIGARLLECIPEISSSMLSSLSEHHNIRLSREKTGQFLMELFMFYMHILDRLAFGYLGPEGHNRFCDRLMVVVVNGIAEDLSDGLSEGSLHFITEFRDTYHERQLEYSKYERWYPEKDGPPGSYSLLGIR